MSKKQIHIILFHKMSGIGKFIGTKSQLVISLVEGGGRLWRGFLGGWLKLTDGGCVTLEIQWIVHYKWVNCVVQEFYLSKAVLKNPPVPSALDPIPSLQRSVLSTDSSRRPVCEAQLCLCMTFQVKLTFVILCLWSFKFSI